MKLGEKIVIDKDGNVVIDEVENVEIVGSKGEVLMNSEILHDMLNRNDTDTADTVLGATDVPLMETAVNPVVVTESVDMTEVVENLEKVNFTLSALLFVVLYAVCAQKIESGVRRLLKLNE